MLAKVIYCVVIALCFEQLFKEATISRETCNWSTLWSSISGYDGKLYGQCNNGVQYVYNVETGERENT